MQGTWLEFGHRKVVCQCSPTLGFGSSLILIILVGKTIFVSICTSQKPSISCISPLVGLAMMFYSFLREGSHYFHLQTYNFSVRHLKCFMYLPVSDSRPQIPMESVGGGACSSWLLFLQQESDYLCCACEHQAKPSSQFSFSLHVLSKVI